MESLIVSGQTTLTICESPSAEFQFEWSTWIIKAQDVFLSVPPGFWDAVQTLSIPIRDESKSYLVCLWSSLWTAAPGSLRTSPKSSMLTAPHGSVCTAPRGSACTTANGSLCTAPWINLLGSPSFYMYSYPKLLNNSTYESMNKGLLMVLFCLMCLFQIDFTQHHQHHLCSSKHHDSVGVRRDSAVHSPPH